MKIINALSQALAVPDKLTRFKNEAHARLEKTNYKQAKRRFLFIIADSGGGHRSTANAVKAEIENRIPDACVYLMPAVDILNTPQRLFSRLIEEGYNQAIKSGAYWMEPLLFNSVYMMELPVVHQYIALRNAQIIDTFQPEAIVAFVPATQELTYLALRHLNKDKEIPLYTVITDMVSMRHNWINPAQAHSFVPTEQAKSYFIGQGIPADKMTVTGLPVHPRFYQQRFDQANADKTVLQAKYQLQPDRFTILLMMGGNGSNSIYKYCKQIDSLGLPVQIIACCGKSQLIKTKVEIYAKISKVPIYAFGFTQEIPELMQVSDLLITKPGSVSIAESITQNLPILIDASTYIMWQEKGNDKYISDHQIGMAFYNTDELSQKLKLLVKDTEAYANIKAKMLAFPKQNATQIITDSLLSPQLMINSAP